jgi:tetratricopeptide (TPR) repeat protein
MTAGRWIRIVLLAGVLAAVSIGTLLWWQSRGLKLVEDRLAAGDAPGALAAVDAYLDSHPHNSRALRMRARALVELERPEDAAHIFYQVGADQPEDLLAWAKAHVRLGQFSPALQILESLQKIEPPSAETLETITFCRFALGNRDAALASAQQLADLPGHEATGHLQLALLYRDWGSPSLANEHFARVLEYRPDATDLRLEPADFFMTYGIASLAAGDARQALEAFERSAEILPSPDALLLQAEAWQARGDGEKAEALREQFVRQYPRHPASQQFNQIARQVAAPPAAPQPQQATTVPSRTDSAADDGHAGMLRLLDQIRQRTDAENPYLGKGPLRDWQRQLASLPTDAEVAARFDLLNKIAVKQLELGETEEAIEHLQQCLALVPEDATALVDRVQYQLAVAYLRRAENENCIHCANGESCILPIRGGGIHQFTSGSQGAIKHLTPVLERNPDHVAARWLLNLAYMTLGGYPDDVPAKFLVPPELFEEHEDFPRFENIARQLGLDENGLSGGIIVDDFNGDGRLDVVTSQWSTSGQLRIYMGQPDGTFLETTEEAGLTGIYGGLNIIQADYDNDGDLDILVLRGGWWGEAGCHPNSLLANDGTGRFRDVTFEVGLGEAHYPTQTASWADYDNDGNLDLFIGNEGFPCQLFKNNGRGYFTDVAQKAGVADGGYAKAVVWGDYDGDRYPDLYVSNLDGPNRLFRNNRDGTFTDVAAELGVEGPTRSFPAWFWDFNNDGVLDLFVAAYTSNIAAFAADHLGLSHQGETDRLYQGDGRGGFRDVSREMNVQRVTVPMGSNFGDLNNNGFLDYYLGTGEPNYDALMPNRMFLNQGGQGFADVSTAGGFSHLQKGHGVAFADFDEDGDLDVFIVMGGAYPGDAFPNAVFENPGFGNHWLKVSLVGEISNRFGVGARIRADIEEDGEQRSIYRWINSGGTFGANPLRAHIGMGRATKVNTLEVYWPTSDITQTFTDIPADQSIQIVEGRDQWQAIVSSQ